MMHAAVIFSLVPASTDRPIIFLDVDGTLIPFGPRPGSRRSATCQPTERQQAISDNPLLDRLDPADGLRFAGTGVRAGLGDDVDGGRE
jgi:hypothetical protein